MTTAGRALPKYLRVAAGIRRQIADGTLRPGQPAPSGAELSRDSGFSTLTCRKALRTLIGEGLLVPGPSPNARPRVADPQAPDLERDLAEAARALSAGLAERRHAAGLTQAELATLAGVSVTTVGHAETGRTWQSRRFWDRADAALRAAGELLRLHDAFRAASSPRRHQRSTSSSPERTLRPSLTAGVSATWPDPAAHALVATSTDAAPAQQVPEEAGTALAGTPCTSHVQPGTPLPDPNPNPTRACQAQACLAQVGTALADPALAGQAQSPSTLAAAFRSEFDPPSAVPRPVGSPPIGSPSVGFSPVGPARIVIVWTDGTITTVHAPEVIARPPEATRRDLER